MGLLDKSEDELHDCVREEGDDKSDDGVKDCVFCVGNFFRVASGDGVFKAAVNEHNNREGADEVKDDIREFCDNSGVADKFGRHVIGFNGFDSVADGEGHNLSGEESTHGGSASEDLGSRFN